MASGIEDMKKSICINNSSTNVKKIDSNVAHSSAISQA
jgi:hypothetical protein